MFRHQFHSILYFFAFWYFVCVVYTEFYFLKGFMCIDTWLTFIASSTFRSKTLNRFTFTAIDILNGWLLCFHKSTSTSLLWHIILAHAIEINNIKQQPISIEFKFLWTFFSSIPVSIFIHPHFAYVQRFEYDCHVRIRIFLLQLNCFEIPKIENCSVCNFLNCRIPIRFALEHLLRVWYSTAVSA